MSFPAAHPRAGDEGEVYGYLVRSVAGPILVDTGVGTGDDRIDEMYRPRVIDVRVALASAGITAADLAGVVLSHGHFDHCGQHFLLGDVPVWVQAAEWEAMQQPGHTVAEWATVHPSRLKLVDGDVEIASDVALVATPGHTPGHQSVVVTRYGQRAVIAGQVCHTADEFALMYPAETDMHDESWLEAGRASVRRLHDLSPNFACFSHDDAVWLKQ